MEAARIQGLLAELMTARQELTEKAAELRRVATERDELRTRLAQADDAARELSSALRAETALRGELAAAHAASGTTLRARVAELELALEEQRKAPTEQAGLRRIRGIGPAYERALLGLGITSIAQIAALSLEDIERIAPLIKARAERIVRDDWVGQAQRLDGAQPEP
jgi:predicted flap endonuclease-1-like 5' DNA nuclease